MQQMDLSQKVLLVLYLDMSLLQDITNRRRILVRYRRMIGRHGSGSHKPFGTS
jgi:hypothetical protein